MGGTCRTDGKITKRVQYFFFAQWEVVEIAET
jgi:hypothetical protein